MTAAFLGNILFGLGKVLDLVLEIYTWIIIARAVISWVSPDPYNPIIQFLYRATEPVLGFIRRRVPLAMGGLDLSPILALLAIAFLRYAVVKTLIDLAYRLQP